MVIVLIRTRMRPDADLAAYEALNGSMYELVRRIPGYLGVSGYTSADGEDIGVARFASLEALRAWREHPDHVVARERGRAQFYASYIIEVCEVVRTTTFDTASGEPVALPLRTP